ncbi:MAG: DHH family phosphoesterase [Chloroflexota bacterium]
MRGVCIPEIEPIDAKRLEQLRTAAGNGPVLILTHDNPDPDAMAAGKALATLLEKAWGIACHLVYQGLVARAENKAMLSLLVPEWKQADVIADMEQYSAIALVDTQPGAGNNSLPDRVPPQIVFDHHHPVRQGLDRVKFVDVRPTVGATVSLIYLYLDAAGIKPDADLATAIFYGIQADTRSLSRGDSPTDQAVYFRMLEVMDRQKLVQVEQAGLPRDYFRAFSKGLQAARVYGKVVTVYLGAMHRPDFAAEIGDMLIRMDGVRAVLCQGYFQKKMQLSLRTRDLEDDAGLVIQQIVVAPGRAGGHGMAAGGQVPLVEEQAADEVAADVEARFLRLMGETGEGEPLLM